MKMHQNRWRRKTDNEHDVIPEAVPALAGRIAKYVNVNVDFKVCLVVSKEVMLRSREKRLHVVGFDR